ncbi:MAG: STAS domain-containing protein [Acidobacteria bacterium]|nr:STAS domain-containing protein [Acidobacteriota bacterium]
MSFTISSRKRDGIEILTLAGRLVLGDGTGLLRTAVRKSLEEGNDLLLDLAGLGYMDSAGLGELVGSYASASSRMRQMKLMRPQDRIGTLLQITKLYATFEVFPDEASALAAFSEHEQL